MEKIKLFKKEFYSRLTFYQSVKMGFGICLGFIMCKIVFFVVISLLASMFMYPIPFKPL